MKGKSFLGVVILMLLVGFFIHSYQSGFRRAPKAKVVFAADNGDAPSQRPSYGKYDPYFAKRNSIPDRIN